MKRRAKTGRLFCQGGSRQTRRLPFYPSPDLGGCSAVERSTVVVDPDFVHGANGYKRCGCPVCREGHRARQAAYRARARERRPPAAEPPPPPAEGVGTLERLATDATAALLGTRSAEGDLLRAQALAAARTMDEAMSSGRPHLLAPANRILNDSLDRLRGLAPQRPAPGRQRTPEEMEADEFVDSLTKFGEWPR